ncbi:MAG: DUF86 domain-containing protein [Rhodospirillales bacterium]|nr:DUF86 domain-containing protein [Rhodospirillales bacterium]
MKRDVRDDLDDMLTYALQAQAFVGGFSAEDFIADKRTCYAVTYSLHVIGEAAKKVPPETRERYPHIPWMDIVGMRNRLVHDYLGTDPNIIYQTVVRFLPELSAALPQVISDLDETGDRAAP